MPQPQPRAKLHTTPFPCVLNNGVRLRIESHALLIRGRNSTVKAVDTSTVITSVYLDGTQARILRFEGPDAALDAQDQKEVFAVFDALGVGHPPVLAFVSGINQTRAAAFANPLDA